jgi:dTDP-4-dehydrorhamnose 3,5-epimerase
MKFIRTEISDLIICEPQVFDDNRGYFSETFREDKLEKFLGYNINFCQENESKSTFGVLRGLHYQLPPYAQTKLVRVVSGEVLDVAVDLRKDSLTFGKCFTIKLTGENKKQLLIPRGFAHGFVVLSKEAVFAYKVDNYYNPQSERGIFYNDKILNVNWELPDESISLSIKDKVLPNFVNAEYFNSKESL